MDLLDFAVHSCLALQVLTVQPLDELVSWLFTPEIRVMAITEVELAVRRGVIADPPAAWLMTVVLLHQLVDACGDCAENAELFKVRAESRPEPVIRAGLVDGARVHLEPVADKPHVLKLYDRARYGRACQAGYDNRTPLQRCSPPSRRPCAAPEAYGPTPDSGPCFSQPTAGLLRHSLLQSAASGARRCGARAR